MRVTPRSAEVAERLSSRSVLRAGWHEDAIILTASEGLSKRRNEMIEVLVGIADQDGEQREIRDWLTDSPLGSAKLRTCCEAVGALDRYEAGLIGESDFIGRQVRVLLSVKKQRGYPDKNVIESYGPSKRG